MQLFWTLAVAASVWVLSWGGAALPGLQLLTSLLAPVPLTLLTVYLGWGAGVLASLVYLVALGATAGLDPVLLAVIQPAGLGLVYGFLLQKGKGVGRTLLAGAALAGAGLLLLWHELAQAWTAWRQGLAASVEPTMEFYRQSGFLEMALRQGLSEADLRQAVLTLVEHSARLFPTVVYWEQLLLVVGALGLAWLVLRRAGRVGPLPAFPQWQLPWYLVWGVIGGLALALVGDYLGREALVVAGENVLVFYVPFLLVNGLAVGSHLYLYLAAPLFLKVAVVLILLFNLPLGVLAVLLLGLFDPLLNLRRLAPVDKDRGGGAQ